MNLCIIGAGHHDTGLIQAIRRLVGGAYVLIVAATPHPRLPEEMNSTSVAESLQALTRPLDLPPVAAPVHPVESLFVASEFRFALREAQTIPRSNKERDYG